MKKRWNLNRKSGQIWVETMVYTLIAFALIGLVLAFVKPKIEEVQDSTLISQSVEVLEDIDSIISEVAIGGTGNQRVPELGISKGTFTIDAPGDSLFFVIESRYEYSQPGTDVSLRGITVHTEQIGRMYDVTLTKDYSGVYNITSEGLEEVRQLTSSSTPYKVVIAANGSDSSGNQIINMGVSI